MRKEPQDFPKANFLNPYQTGMVDQKEYPGHMKEDEPEYRLPENIFYQTDHPKFFAKVIKLKQHCAFLPLFLQKNSEESNNQKG